MTYVDGFVAAVPTANKAKYIKHASEAAAENYGGPTPATRREPHAL